MIEILKNIITRPTKMVLHFLLVMIATVLPFSMASAVGQLTQNVVPHIHHENARSIERNILASSALEEEITQYLSEISDVDTEVDVEAVQESYSYAIEE